MRFVVIPNRSGVPREGRDVAYLWTDNWNDWFRFQTLYVLGYFDPGGQLHEIGAVKIGQFDMAKDQTRPDLPPDFEELDERFFSLGQDTSYYSSIAALDEELASRLLAALRDVVADPALFRRALDQDVMGVSLLRSVTVRSVEGQFRRILTGGAVLTDYSFQYQGPEPEDEGIDRLNLEFRVIHESKPPTNIHVLIGRDGVGKTFLLSRMTDALLSSSENPQKDGIFLTEEDVFNTTNESPFANILSVTFSAFDEFTHLREGRNVSDKTRYSNVSLRRQVRDKDGKLVTITQDPVELAEEFSTSARLCVMGQRAARWQRALTTLQADPLFAEAEVADLVGVDEAFFTRTARQIYRRLSSGHKIVLLTITKLVEKVEEKTLVLLDEPEAHLRPPLLSAFVRALSDLLIDRNGVAIIATHSPVVLQEVPASCVWKIVRHGLAARADRPEIETFGENIGVLTREIFGLEVTRSGFHQMLAEAIADLDNIDAVLRRFDNEVGSEGRALISSLLAARRAADGQ